MFTIERYPAFEDNYVFLLVDERAKAAAVVDPGDAMAVLPALRSRELALTEILVTHHHRDHVGGVKLLVECYPDVRVTCGRYDAERKRVPHAARVVGEGDVLEFADVRARVLDVPGHTAGHVAYVFDEARGPASGTDAFVGDTLFGAGSGGLFEGTPAQMLEALRRIRALPADTRIWCAHEYTEKNLWVALRLKEDNPAQRTRFEEVAAMRAGGLPTVPLALSEERETNPFLRWDAPTLRAALGTADDLTTFAAVRAFRDKF